MTPTLNVPLVFYFKVMIFIIKWQALWFLKALSFFPSLAFFVHQNYAIKKCKSLCWFKSLRPSNLFACSIDWKTISCSQNDTCLFTWLHDFHVQYRMHSAILRNHLYCSYQIFEYSVDRLTCQSKDNKNMRVQINIIIIYVVLFCIKH